MIIDLSSSRVLHSKRLEVKQDYQRSYSSNLSLSGLNLGDSINAAVASMECVGQPWYRSTSSQGLIIYLAHSIFLRPCPAYCTVMPAYPRTRFTDAAPFSFEGRSF